VTRERRITVYSRRVASAGCWHTGLLEIGDRGYVLENGEVVMSGPSSELIDSDRIRQAYLGL